LLPESCLRYYERGDRAVPAWLTDRDEPWVDALTRFYLDCAGHTAGEIDTALRERILPMCLSMGAPRRAPAGVRHVLSQLFPTRIDAAARPSEIRQTLFSLAPACASRQDAIDAAARTLGIRPDQVLAGLFADRAPLRKVDRCDHVPSAREVVERYNLALLQGIIQRAQAVRVRAREHTRSVVRFARLRKLICLCSLDREGTRLDMSGPLSMFRHTTRYGNAMASFLPALLSAPGWQIDATCLLRSYAGEPPAPGDPYPRKPMVVRACSGVPIASDRLDLPADDRSIERRLLRDMRRLGTEWEIERETQALQVGHAVFFPDFVMRKGAQRVLVELVGYHTTSYLRHKLRLLEQAVVRNVVLCVDRSLSCDGDSIDGAAVLGFERRIDAADLVALAERMVAG